MSALDLVLPPLKAADKFKALQAAISDYQIPCRTDFRFIADPSALTPVDRSEMVTKCGICDARGPCSAYATAANPPAGTWAGITYPRTKLKAQKHAS